MPLSKEGSGKTDLYSQYLSEYLRILLYNCNIVEWDSQHSTVEFLVRLSVTWAEGNVLIELMWSIIFLHVVAKFAAEKIQPLVREMDEKGEIDKSIVQAMFDQGVWA